MKAFFNAVNTYTDASVIKDPVVGFITCAGFVTTFRNEVIDSGYKITVDGTNNYGEISAIHLGVQSLLNFKMYDTFLNLFSDSRISVLGLREWIYNWKRNEDPQTRKLINSSGNMVENQEVFCNIIYHIVQNNTHLSLWHQRGHQDPYNVNGMETVKSSFTKENGIELPEDIVYEICYYNNMVDKMTRDALHTTVNNKDFRELNCKKPKVTAQRLLNWDMLNIYKNLIGGK